MWVCRGVLHQNVGNFITFFRVRKIAQLALQEINLSRKFNFNLVFSADKTFFSNYICPRPLS